MSEAGITQLKNCTVRLGGKFVILMNKIWQK